MSTDTFEDLNAVPAVRLLAMLASAGAVIMAVQDATRTIAAEQLLFSGSLLLACLAGSIRTEPASSTPGSSARCWPAPLRRPGGRGYGSARLGLAPP